MKKSTRLFLTFVTIFSMVACGRIKPAPGTGVVPTPSSTASPGPTPKLAINTTTAKLTTGQSITLSVPGATSIVWSSSDPYIAKVDKNGVVTGRHKGGTTTISAEADGQVFTCTVTNVVTMRDISSAEIVAEMKIGTNYASALDDLDWDRKVGYDYSTTGKAKITKYLNKVGWAPTDKVAADFKKGGYNAVRLGISFSLFTDDKTFEIDKEWLDLIEATVNDFLDNDMDCILEPHYDYLQYSWVGDHWDGMWTLDKYDDYVNARYEAIWRQVAERFADYDDHLLFEAVNEPSIDTPEYIKMLGSEDGRDELLLHKSNEMNTIFLETIRATGGNNASRHLILALPEIEDARFLPSLKLPDNDDHIIATIHYYFHLEDWSDYHSWSRENQSDTQQIDKEFVQVKQFMDQTHVPVILGEWANTQVIPLEDRIDQATYIIQKAKDLGVPGFWFEGTMSDTDRANMKFSLYNRYKNVWYWPELRDAIMNVVYER